MYVAVTFVVELFLNNVFDQLVKDVLKVSRHQSTSFTIEKLVRLAGADPVKQLLQVFCSNFDVRQDVGYA